MGNDHLFMIPQYVLTTKLRKNYAIA